MNRKKAVVIFGGSGFIGSHFSQFALDNSLVDKVFIFDIKPLNVNKTTLRYKQYIESGLIEHVYCDVRGKIPCTQDFIVDFIVNLAAIHREPGHELSEYYETNLLGAENICNWAEIVGCNRIIFTSSVAVYGPSEEVRTEKSIPVPISAYGASKLSAEKIHCVWQAKNTDFRKLVVVRPGVVFGAGENGNVTRLVKAVLRNYFFYVGNKRTRKAGTYVKELCNAMWWAMDRKAGTEYILFNMSMDPGPTIEDYVKMVCTTANIRRHIFSAPYGLLLTASYFIELFAKLFRTNQPVSPVRVGKLVSSNNISPQFLLENDYSYEYSLESAMEDWKRDRPLEWR